MYGWLTVEFVSRERSEDENERTYRERNESVLDDSSSRIGPRTLHQRSFSSDRCSYRFTQSTTNSRTHRQRPRIEIGPAIGDATKEVPSVRAKNLLGSCVHRSEIATRDSGLSSRTTTGKRTRTAYLGAGTTSSKTARGSELNRRSKSRGVDVRSLVVRFRSRSTCPPVAGNSAFTPEHTRTYTYKHTRTYTADVDATHLPK